MLIVIVINGFLTVDVHSHSNESPDMHTDIFLQDYIQEKNKFYRHSLHNYFGYFVVVVAVVVAAVVVVGVVVVFVVVAYYGRYACVGCSHPGRPCDCPNLTTQEKIRQNKKS